MNVLTLVKVKERPCHCCIFNYKFKSYLPNIRKRSQCGRQGSGEYECENVNLNI